METSEIRSILLEALQDEYKAEATYASVIARFGPVRPFVNIIEAERRHAEAIRMQLQRHGWECPSNSWFGKVPPPETLLEACEAAIEAEEENIRLYDRLLPQIGDRGARRVLENLQRASRDHHLPAFRRCQARQKGAGGARRGCHGAAAS